MIQFTKQDSAPLNRNRNPVHQNCPTILSATQFFIFRAHRLIGINDRKVKHVNAENSINFIGNKLFLTGVHKRKHWNKSDQIYP